MKPTPTPPIASCQAGLRILDLGCLPYEDAWRLQREHVEQRADGRIPDTVLLCEHPHVITVGRAERDDGSWPSMLPGPEGPVPVQRIERGGLATYHGPGQLVAYPILRLDRIRRGLEAYLRLLEEAAIRTCRDFGVTACRREGFTGVWVKGGSNPGCQQSAVSSQDGAGLKIASIGVAVRRWVTYHGLALNVNTDLRYFGLIRPCGFDAGVMTSLQELREVPVQLQAARESLTSHLSGLLSSAGCR